MASTRVLTARNAAWKTLNQSHLFKHDTAEVLDSLLGQCDRPAQATDITFGVIRHQKTIDHILRQCATLEPARVKPAQWNLLRIGVYELVFAPKTADYAILNEAAELAGRAGTRKSTGFINAVLRNVQRAIQNRYDALEDNNVRRVVPQTSDTGCAFKSELIPSPEKEPARYLSIAYSLPQPLIDSWLKVLGFEQVRAICLASNRNPSVIAQPNILLESTDKLAAQLEDEGISCEQSDQYIRICTSGKLNRSKAYLEGHFFIQDPTASSAIERLNPQPGWTIIDLCAAPGGKCLAAAIRMQDTGTIIATDIDSKRLTKVRDNAKRMRLESIQAIPSGRIDQTIRKLKQIDAIILDVPCSNTGVLARRVEARWRWKIREIQSLQKIQQDLLDKSAEFARKNTKILYSTCSIQPEENQQQVQAFCKRHKEFMVLSEKTTLPAIKTPDNFDHDGGYAAVMVRR